MHYLPLWVVAIFLGVSEVEKVLNPGETDVLDARQMDARNYGDAFSKVTTWWCVKAIFNGYKVCDRGTVDSVPGTCRWLKGCGFASH